MIYLGWSGWRGGNFKLWKEIWSEIGQKSAEDHEKEAPFEGFRWIFISLLTLRVRNGGMQRLAGG